ncbi:hypothetical protein CR513_25029, partial [Mucuna pruriens]
MGACFDQLNLVEEDCTLSWIVVSTPDEKSIRQEDPVAGNVIPSSKWTYLVIECKAENDAFS